MVSLNNTVTISLWVLKAVHQAHLFLHARLQTTIHPSFTIMVMANIQAIQRNRSANKQIRTSTAWKQ